MLEVEGVRFAYQSRAVLKDVRFAVRPGELVAVLGPNGSGKTTLLKCINAMLKPSHGAVRMEGADVLKMLPTEIARRVGYVAQKSEPMQLTAFDAVLMGRRPHIRWKVSPRDLAVVQAVLERLGLDTLSLRTLDRMSGGELQKICLARALVQEPRLLLLDEPTSSLDLKNQIEILTLIRQAVHEHAMAAVMTMHDLNLALRFANKFIFLKDGGVFAAGDTSTVTAEMITAVYDVPVMIQHLAGIPLVAPLDSGPSLFADRP